MARYQNPAFGRGVAALADAVMGDPAQAAQVEALLAGATNDLAQGYDQRARTVGREGLADILANAGQDPAALSRDVMAGAVRSGDFREIDPGSILSTFFSSPAAEGGLAIDPMAQSRLQTGAGVQRFGDTEVGHGQSLANAIQTAGIAADAQRYGHDRRYEGTAYTADRRYDADVYGTDVGAEVDRENNLYDYDAAIYGHDRDFEGTAYTADSRADAARYGHDRDFQADMFGHQMDLAGEFLAPGSGRGSERLVTVETPEGKFRVPDGPGVQTGLPEGDKPLGVVEAEDTLSGLLTAQGMDIPSGDPAYNAILAHAQRLEGGLTTNNLIRSIETVSPSESDNVGPSWLTGHSWDFLTPELDAAPANATAGEPAEAEQMYAMARAALEGTDGQPPEDPEYVRQMLTEMGLDPARVGL